MLYTAPIRINIYTISYSETIMKKSLVLSIGLLLGATQSMHGAAAASRLLSTKAKLASVLAAGLGVVYYGDYQRSTNTNNPELDALFHLGQRVGNVVKRGGKAGAEIIEQVGAYLEASSANAREELEDAGNRHIIAPDQDTLLNTAAQPSDPAQTDTADRSLAEPNELDSVA
jgi:hypothetical protein